MTQFVCNAQDSETYSLYAGIRQTALNAQHWEREKFAHLVQNEGICLKDEHWAVITYLHNSYIEYGQPRYARTKARALNQQFYVEGGSKCLYDLFAGGPVTQGSRLVKLRTPANTTGVSFGISY